MKTHLVDFGSCSLGKGVLIFRAFSEFLHKESKGIKQRDKSVQKSSKCLNEALKKFGLSMQSLRSSWSEKRHFRKSLIPSLPSAWGEKGTHYSINWHLQQTSSIKKYRKANMVDACHPSTQARADRVNDLTEMWGNRSSS